MFLPLNVGVTHKVTSKETVTVSLDLEARSKYGDPPPITIVVDVVATPRLRYKKCVEVPLVLGFSQTKSPERVEVAVVLEMDFGSLRPSTGQGELVGVGCGSRFEFYPYIGATIRDGIGGSSAVLDITVTPTVTVTVPLDLVVELPISVYPYPTVHENAYSLVVVTLDPQGSSEGAEA